MAVQQRLRVAMDDVFPNGAFLVGEVTAAEDYEIKQAGNADPQVRDKVSGERVWNVRVLDADPETRRGQAEVTVKIAAPHVPVPPEALPGLPFRPVEFDGLTITPYIDTNGSRPKQAYSYRATGMHAPAKPAAKPTAAGEQRNAA